MMKRILISIFSFLTVAIFIATAFVSRTSSQTTQPTPTNIITVYSDGSIQTAPVTPPVPPITATMPSIVLKNYIPTTSPSNPWPTTSPANPYGAWEVVSFGSQPDNRTLINIPVGQPIPSTIPANSEVVLNGGNYIIYQTLNLNSSTIRSIGGASSVTLTWDGANNGVLIQASGNYPIIQGITFIGPNASCSIATSSNTTNLIVDGCVETDSGPASFCNLADPNGPNGYIIHNCQTSNIGAYSVFTGGSDGAILNCSFSNSSAEHLIRGTGNRILVQGDTLANLQSVGAAASKDALAPQGGSYWSVVNNNFGVGGPISIGPILTSTAINPPIILDIELRNNVFFTPINVNPGVSGIFIHVNQITTSPFALNINGSVSTFPYLSINGLNFSGNTVINNGSTGAMLKGFAGAISDIAQIINNNYSQSGVVIGNGNYFSASVCILDANLSSYNFSGNVYGKPWYYSYQLPQFAPFHSFCVGNTSLPTSGPQNFVLCPSTDIQN